MSRIWIPNIASIIPYILQGREPPVPPVLSYVCIYIELAT